MSEGTLYLPPLPQSVPENGYDEIKDFLLLEGFQLPVRISPCVPRQERMYALFINEVLIAYHNDAESARRHLERIRGYYQRGGTFTSQIVLANL